MPDTSKIASVIAKHEAPSAGADSSSESTPGTPPSGAGSGEESASAGASTGTAAANASSEAAPAAPDPAEQERAEKHALMREQLREIRQRNQAKAELRRARETQTKAEADAKAAAEERERWAKVGKEGSFLDAIKASGRDPRQVFEEMQKEAIEAGTPEAQMRALEAKFDKALAEKLGPLEERLAQMTKERDEAVAKAGESAWVSTFNKEVNSAAFQGLRVEYDAPDLYRFVTHMRNNPQELHHRAQALNVPLTRGGDHATITRNILSVLQATQDEHEKRKASRAAQYAATPGQAATRAPATTRPATVNGTAERKAGTSLGNDLASETATERPRLTRAQRVEAAVKKYG